MSAAPVIDTRELDKERWPTLSDPEKFAVTALNATQTHIRPTGDDLTPEAVSVEVKTLILNREEGWQLRPWGMYRAVPVKKNRRPGTFNYSMKDVSGEDVLRSFFEMGTAWEKLNDASLYAALVAWANEHATLTPRVAVTMSRAVCLAIAYRAGLDVEWTDLETAR